jgi:hypothetical protein
LNGHLVKSIDTYSAATKTGVAILAFKGASAVRTVVVRPLGVHSAKAKGSFVQLDGLIASV